MALGRAFNDARMSFWIASNIIAAFAASDTDRRSSWKGLANARDAVKALLVANEFLQAQIEELHAAVPNGYARGPVPRDRKDWYD